MATDSVVCMLLLAVATGYAGMLQSSDDALRIVKFDLHVSNLYWTSAPPKLKNCTNQACDLYLDICVDCDNKTCDELYSYDHGLWISSKTKSTAGVNFEDASGISQSIILADIFEGKSVMTWVCEDSYFFHLEVWLGKPFDEHVISRAAKALQDIVPSPNFKQMPAHDWAHDPSGTAWFYNVSMTFKCKETHFGPHCGTYCVEQPGMFTCNENGSIQCNEHRFPKNEDPTCLDLFSTSWRMSPCSKYCIPEHGAHCDHCGNDFCPTGMMTESYSPRVCVPNCGPGGNGGCFNGGICMPGEPTGSCDCPAKFTGPHCEFEVTTTPEPTTPSTSQTSTSTPHTTPHSETAPPTTSNSPMPIHTEPTTTSTSTTSTTASSPITNSQASSTPSTTKRQDPVPAPRDPNAKRGSGGKPLAVGGIIGIVVATLLVLALLGYGGYRYRRSRDDPLTPGGINRGGVRASALSIENPTYGNDI